MIIRGGRCDDVVTVKGCARLINNTYCGIKYPLTGKTYGRRYGRIFKWCVHTTGALGVEKRVIFLTHEQIPALI